MIDFIFQAAVANAVNKDYLLQFLRHAALQTTEKQVFLRFQNFPFVHFAVVVYDAFDV